MSCTHPPPRPLTHLGVLLGWLLACALPICLSARPAAACGWCDASEARARGYLDRLEVALRDLDGRIEAAGDALGPVVEARLTEARVMLAEQRDAIVELLEREGEAWAAVAEVRAAELLAAVRSAEDQVTDAIARGRASVALDLDRLATGTRGVLTTLFADAGLHLDAARPDGAYIAAAVSTAERSLLDHALSLGIALAGLMLLGFVVPTLGPGRWGLRAPLIVAGLVVVGIGVWRFIPRDDTPAAVGIDSCPALVEARTLGPDAGPADRARLRHALALCRVRAVDPALARLALDARRALTRTAQEASP